MVSYDHLMLASLLPGFRHVRTPLLTGALYLATVWLIFGEDALLPTSDSAGALGALADLAALLGQGVTLASASLIAYLLGTFLVVSSWPFSTEMLERPWVSFRLRRATTNLLTSVTSDNGYGVARDVYIANQWASPLQEWARGVADRADGRFTYADLELDLAERTAFLDEIRLEWRHAQLRRWQTANSAFEHEGGREPTAKILTADELPPWDPGPEGWEKNREHEWWNYENSATDRVPSNTLYEALMATAEEELRYVASRLRVEGSATYDGYDQKISEAELRYSITPPLVVLVVVFAATWNWAALLALVAPVLLARQGFHAERAAKLDLLLGLRYGVAKSPLAEGIANIQPRDPVSINVREVNY